MMKHNILLWGTGERVQQFIERGYFRQCNIAGLVDTYRRKEDFRGYKVYLPEELHGIMDKIDYLVIANQYFGENLELCIRLGIEWDKIVLTDNVCEPLYHNRFLELGEVSGELFALLNDRPMKLVKINESDPQDGDRMLGNGKYGVPLYMEDYFRYRTFEFVAGEIKRRNVAGAAAELGVFRGTFSSIINDVFKEKKLYLFDTFDGFGSEEAEKEINLGRCSKSFVTAHKDTSVNQMLENLPNPGQCIVCKGLFPESVSEEASGERYSFVSIDVDFEESTYQGLEFFYPRLSEGGAIFVHDYNTFFLGGVKQAVDRYESENGIRLKKVPLADRAGTLVIVK